MNNDSWLKFIERSTEAPHIREIFNHTFALLKDEEVQKLFFSRIDELLEKKIGSKNKDALESLREDIELEIEHGQMLAKAMEAKAVNPRPLPVKIGPVSKLTKLERLMRMISTMRNELDQMERVVSSIVRDEQ